MSEKQPTTEDLLKMDGGIDATQISDNTIPAIPAIPTLAEVPVESQSAIKRRLEDSIDNFLESDTAIAQGGGDITGRPNVQFPDSVLNGSMVEESNNPQTIERARASSPIDRFKSFIAVEKQLNPKFDVSKDLDAMIDYLIEQENLEAKFARFNNPSSQVEETYKG